MSLVQQVNDLAKQVHQGNVDAGWWSDINTKTSALATRSRPEILMLVVSEVSEADDGFTNNLNDDKLPELPMFDVELADVGIRQLDVLGAEASLHGGEPIVIDNFDNLLGSYVKNLLLISNVRSRLMEIVNRTSAAMEHLRKGRTAQYREELAKGLAMTIAVARVHQIDLFDVMDQKRNFNANRSDHKIENRLKEDGKKF